MRFLITFLSAAITVAAQVNSIHVDGLRSKTVRLVAYTNCTAVPEPGKKIEQAVIIVRGEQIVSVGKGTSIPAGAEVHDLKGAWVYAGFVEPYMDVAAFTESGEAKGRRAPSNEDDEDGGPTTPAPKGAHYWNEAVRPEKNPTENLSITEAAASEWTKFGIMTGNVASHDGVFSGSSTAILLRQGPGSRAVLADATTQNLSFRKGSSQTPYPTSLMGSIALIRQAFIDADWYGKAKGSASQPDAVRTETNISLQALNAAVKAGTVFTAVTQDEHDFTRWAIIAKEAGIKVNYVGTGSEYRRLAAIAKLKNEAGGMNIILPVNFPETPDVRNPIEARNVPLNNLINWYWAPDNARLLDSIGCKIAFTTSGLKDKSALLKNVRLCVERGLDSAKALAGLTTVPAELSGVSSSVGTIAAKKLANLVILTDNIFSEDVSVQGIVVAGKEEILDAPAEIDVRGKWTLTSNAIGRNINVEIKGTSSKPSATMKVDTMVLSATFNVQGKDLSFTVELDSVGIKGTARAAAKADSILVQGNIVMPDGKKAAFTMARFEANKSDKATEGDKATKDEKELRRGLPNWLPLGAFGFSETPKQEDVLLKNATVWTCAADGVMQNADVRISGGKITAVGKGLSGGRTIDCTGMHITPGIIDEHSHIAISRGVNEGSHAVTVEVRIGDVLNPDDINIYRQITGGVTATHLLHGSANPMGGQLQFIRMRWGADAEGLKWQGATPTVKFALGENVKQSNWGDRYSVRYPQTRMGVEEIMRDAFRAAREYEKEMASTGATPVRRDIQLDALLEILNGKRKIHCHSYVQSEILMLMRLAEEFGFRVHTFTHILEGYKVASEMAKHGAMASSFADWWAYKFEVYDAIPENPGIMHDAGVVVSVNSDDGEMARRLNQEAGKSVAYSGISEEEALKFCTINPAKQMMVDNVVGSLEAGKEADVVVWSGNPLSTHSRVEHTFVEGREMFSREINDKLKARDAELRSFLEQAAIKAIAGGAASSSGGKSKKREYHCDTFEDEMAGTAEQD